MVGCDTIMQNTAVSLAGRRPALYLINPKSPRFFKSQRSHIHVSSNAQRSFGTSRPLTRPPMSSNNDGSSQQVSSLLQRINDIAKESHDVLEDQSARAALLQASRELTASLEQPDDIVSNVAFSGGRYMCVRVADELGLFDRLSRTPHTTAELAKATGAEEHLIIRILRTLCAMGFVGQRGKTYFAVAATHQMTKPSVRAGVKHLYVVNSRAISTLNTLD